MIIVVDAGSLIALSRIGCLWILKRKFTEIVIPQAVYDEVVIKGAKRPNVSEIKKSSWIKIQRVKNIKKIALLNQKIHLGESEAIILAKEMKADLIVLDDNQARQIAIAEGLKVAGVLALLLEAKNQGWITSVKKTLNDLEAQGFFISKDLRKEILKKAEESKTP